jgi:hypothetical protein
VREYSGEGQHLFIDCNKAHGSVRREVL